MEKKGKYLKTAIVYHNEYDKYIDLISGEIYKLSIIDSYVGDMYINFKDGLYPVAECFDVSFKKKNMPKKRILNKLNSAKLLNKKEEDK